MGVLTFARLGVSPKTDLALSIDFCLLVSVRKPSRDVEIRVWPVLSLQSLFVFVLLRFYQNSMLFLRRGKIRKSGKSDDVCL
jgi:hypothetical protein